MSISRAIRNRIFEDNGRFWAGDNISQYMNEGDKELLVLELTEKFEEE